MNISQLDDTGIYRVFLSQGSDSLGFAPGSKLKEKWSDKRIQRCNPCSKIPEGFGYVQCGEDYWIAVKPIGETPDLILTWIPNIIASHETSERKDLGYDYIPFPGDNPKKKKSKETTSDEIEEVEIDDECPSDLEEIVASLMKKSPVIQKIISEMSA
jgi:hypothetical protein